MTTNSLHLTLEITSPVVVELRIPSGGVIGIALGCMLLLAGILILTVLFMRRKRKRKRRKKNRSTEPPSIDVTVPTTSQDAINENFFSVYMPKPCYYNVAKDLYVNSPYYGYDSTGILKLDGLFYDENMACYTRLNSQGSNITVSIRSLDLRDKCKDTLTLQFGVQPPITLCGYMKKDKDIRYFSGPPPVTVGFTSGPKTFAILKKGFEIVFTSTFRKPCPSSTYACKENTCISDQLKCDSYNNCGDKSDENCGLTLGGYVGIGFGAVFLLIAGIAFLFFLCRRSSTTIITTYR